MNLPFSFVFYLIRRMGDVLHSSISYNDAGVQDIRLVRPIHTVNDSHLLKSNAFQRRLLPEVKE